MGVCLPLQMISFPLHCPDAKQVRVTFPFELVYPVRQEYVHLDPYVLLHEGVSRRAFIGVTTAGQVTASRSRQKHFIRV